MAVAFSAVSESHGGTTGSTSAASFGWTHTQTGVPAGVLVFVFTNANAQDATGVTYGTDVLEAVTGGAVTDSAGEPRAVQTYFLGTPTVTGNQTVTVSRNNNANVMYAVCFTVTAAGSTEFAGVVTANADAALAEVNVDDGSLSGTNSLRFCGINSALNAVPTAGANTTVATTYSIDFGTNVVRCARETTAGTGSRPVGCTGTSDDLAAVYLAIREASRVKSPAVGAVEATGQAPTVTATDERYAYPAVGAIAASGQAPTVTVTAPPRVVVGWVALAVPAASGGVSNTNYSPAGGSIEATGQAPSLLTEFKREPAVGTVVVAGQAPTAIQNHICLPGTGSIEVTGLAPQATRQDSVFPGAGSVTATGLAPTASSTDDRNITVSVGTIVAAGFAPSADRTDHQSTAPPIGVVTVSGIAPSVSATAHVESAPAYASLVVTGFAPTVSTSGDQYASPGVGAGVVQGFAPTATNSGDRWVRVGWAALVTPALEGSRSVYPATGSVVAQGLAPIVAQSVSITVPVGSITTQGFWARPGTEDVEVSWDDAGADEGYRIKWGEASGSYHWSADVGADVLTYTIRDLVYDTTYFVRIYALVGGVEQDPSDEMVLTAGRGYVPAVGSIVVQGFAPTVAVSDPTRSPGAGTVVVQGFAPTVAVSGHVSSAPSAGAVVVQGFAPSLLGPVEASPATCAIGVQGFAPTVTGAANPPDDYSWLPTPGPEGWKTSKRKKKEERQEDEAYTEPVVPPLPVLKPRKVDVPSIIPALAVIAERKKAQALRAKQAREARALEDDEDDVLLLMM